MNIARSVLCWMMIAFLPASLMSADMMAADTMAADTATGMVHPYGPAWLNGVTVEQSSSIFAGDTVQTSPKSALKIISPGSSVTVLSDSVVKFEGAAVQVEHGSVKLASSKSMSAQAGVVTATPASNAWTEFELSHVNGTVQIMALKGDLQISDGTDTTTLAQGQQAVQKDSDDTTTAPVQSGAVPPAKKRSKKKAAIIFFSAAGAAGVATGVALALANSAAPRTISPVTP